MAPSASSLDEEEAIPVRTRKAAEQSKLREEVRVPEVKLEGGAPFGMENIPEGFVLPEGATIEFEDSEYDSDPDDPVIASYDVYLKPQIGDGRNVYVLQFPNRESSQPYTRDNNALPFELRIKPQSGHVEIDVPVHIENNYDREWGLKWGGAMKKSEQKGTGMHGMPAGFGIGSVQSKAKPPTEAEQAAAIQASLDNFEEAVRQREVLAKQTLGGQISQSHKHSPQYMLGTFRENQLHLTPVDAMVQMRPQFHHIDAFNEQQQKGSKNANAGAVVGRVPEARAVHMTVKNPIDGEEDSKNNMADRITATQKEGWRRHKYSDENDERSWDAYQHLFIGKGTETNGELKSKMPKFRSAWTDEEYLDEISAPLDAARLSRAKMVRKGKNGPTNGMAGGVDVEISDSSEDESAVPNGNGKEKAAVVETSNDLYDA